MVAVRGLEQVGRNAPKPPLYRLFIDLRKVYDSIWSHTPFPATLIRHSHHRTQIQLASGITIAHAQNGLRLRRDSVKVACFLRSSWLFSPRWSSWRYGDSARTRTYLQTSPAMNIATVEGWPWTALEWARRFHVGYLRNDGLVTPCRIKTKGPLIMWFGPDEVVDYSNGKNPAAWLLHDSPWCSSRISSGITREDS